MPYTAQIAWQRGEDEAFVDNRYSRAHTWRFDGGIEVPASASPHNVPLPFAKEAAVDPEEAFVAALASCHMLWFLGLAAEQGFRVESYDDAAEGVLARDAEGKLAMTRVTLHPAVRFAPDHAPSPAQLDALHHQAHDKCFIANSVKTPIAVIPA